MTTAVDAGEQQVAVNQLWQCDEARLDDPPHHHEDNPHGPDDVRFRARVVQRDGSYVVLEVVLRSRGHVSTPDIGAEIATTPATLRNDARWRHMEDR